MSKTPLQTVRETFGSKQALVDALLPLLTPAEGESNDDLRARLLMVSNRKLLRLHGIAARVKEMGGKDALVKKIAEMKGQPKDLPFLDSLGKKSLGRLLDLHDRLARRARAQA